MSILLNTIRTIGYTDPLLGEAADEIERLESDLLSLQQENTRLRNLAWMFPSKETDTSEAKPLLFYPEITFK